MFTAATGAAGPAQSRRASRRLTASARCTWDGRLPTSWGGRRPRGSSARSAKGKSGPGADRRTGLAPGAVIADVGAGSGYLSRRMAPRVLPGGRILAVDIQPEMLALLANAAEDPRYANIEPVRALRTTRICRTAASISPSWWTSITNLNIRTKCSKASCARCSQAVAWPSSSSAARTRTCRLNDCTR